MWIGDKVEHIGKLVGFNFLDKEGNLDFLRDLVPVEGFGDFYAAGGIWLCVFGVFGVFGSKLGYSLHLTMNYKPFTITVYKAL